MSELVFHWKWELKAPRTALWPLVSDTQRVNEELGLGPWHFADSSTSKQTRLGSTRRLGMKLVWTEHPFEWVVGREFGVQRVYESGPIKELVSKVRLDAPSSGEGTLLEHTVTVVPSGPVMGLLVRAEVGLRLKAAFDRVYALLDDEAIRAVPGELKPTRVELPPERHERARQAIERLVTAGHPRTLCEKLATLVLSGHPRVVDRMRPFALARAWNEDRIATLRLFLHAAREGLLDMSWDLVCPGCRGTGPRVKELKDLKGDAHCPSCQIRIDSAFERSVELAFRPAPAVRDVQVLTFCTGGPAKTPHVVFQRRIAPAGRASVDLKLAPGTYRLRGPGLKGTSALEVAEGETAGTVAFTARSDGLVPATASARSETIAISIANETTEEQLAVLESTAWRDDAVTAAFVVTVEEFRSAFPFQVLAPGVQVGAGRVAILFTDLKSSTECYERLGDGRAYTLVHEHFDVLRKAVANHGGTIVKTIGDAVMASFADPAHGLQACFDIHAGIASYNAINKPPVPVIVKLAFHAGPCLIVNENERLDYFGRTVNVAARLEKESKGGDVIVTDELLLDPAVRKVLEGISHTVERFDAGLKGVEGRFKLARLVPGEAAPVGEVVRSAASTAP
jgi:class 3 adenylate cyclase